MALELRVHGCGGAQQQEEWSETARLAEATELGAGFTMSRPVEQGRLVHLVLAMPRRLRLFDQSAPQYRVWALVRRLCALKPDTSGATLFSYGVAFIGKQPPPSYETDPTTLYDLRPTPERGGMWVAREQPRQTGPFVFPSEQRQAVSVEVAIEIFDVKGQVVGREQTETADISQNGASVGTTLSVEPGSFLRLTCGQPSSSILAVVRGRSTDEDHLARLHLEFVDGRWPG